MNKDFYKDLPSMVCVMLDSYIENFKDRKGFDEAWEKYRAHVLSSSIDDMKMPSAFFKDVILNENNEE